MSAFLGQIHFWLYRKIQLLNEREQLILKESEARLADLAEELYNTAVDLYGKAIPADRKLEMIIDHSNIHGWLQQQIEISAVRESTFIKDLLDCGGDDASDAILEAFIKQGQACGTVAKDRLPEATAPMIYKVMQDFYLNGMPCDAPDTILKDDADHFEWVGNHHNQILHWQKAGVSPVFMAAAYQAWFLSFVQAIDPSFTFKVNLDGDMPTYAIVKA